jgi:hypothetical protein
LTGENDTPFLANHKEIDMKEPSLKFIALLLALPLLVAAADWAWTQGPVAKYKSDGAFAYYDIQDTFGISMGTGVTILGNRHANVQIREAEALNTVGISGAYYQLNFEISVSTTNSGSGYARGSGPIPSDCVTFDKPVNHNLSLKVDTNLLPPPFSKYKGGNIPVAFPNIDLRWTRTDNDWYRWEGHQVTEIGDYLVEHSQGTGVRYFTIPRGSVTLPDIGVPILYTYMNGWLGSEKASNMLMERVPK